MGASTVLVMKNLLTLDLSFIGFILGVLLEVIMLVPVFISDKIKFSLPFIITRLGIGVFIAIFLFFAYRNNAVVSLGVIKLIFYIITSLFIAFYLIKFWSRIHLDSDKIEGKYG